MKNPHLFRTRLVSALNRPTALTTRKLTPVLALAASLICFSSADAITVTFNTAGTTTWTCPTGVTSISVAVQGGGGGGGGAGGAASGRGGGGGGGGCAYQSALTVESGTDYTVTVGGGGTAGAATSGTGGTGGASSFSGGIITTLTANGGAGGALGGVSNTSATSGGTATGGAVNFSGGTGGGARIATTGGGGGGGAGTTSVGGSASGTNGVTPGTGGTGSPAGGAGTGNGAAVGGGTAGNAPGGGGAGAYRGTSPAQAGYAGGRGQIIITYTEPTTVKDDNSDNLNLTTSWVGGVAPGSSSLAKWDSTVTSANTTSLGADLTFGGITVANPGGLVTINSGNALTLGAALVDLDLSAATQNLTLNCDLALGAANVWNVASGRTAILGGAVSGSSTVTKQGAGTVTLSGASNYTGNTTVTGGTLNITGSLTGDTAASSLLMGTTAASTVVNVSGNMDLLTISGANLAGSSTAYNQTAGMVNTFPTGTTNFVAKTGYGSFKLTGGTYKVNSSRFSVTDIGTTAVGVAYVGGTGILELKASTTMIVGYTGIGSLTVGPGGIVDRSATTGNFWLTTNAGSYGVLNIAGGSVDTPSSAIRFGNSNAGIQTGFVNLAMGTLTLGVNGVNSVTSVPGSNLYTNYAGGTLKAAANLTAVVPATNGFLTSLSTVFGPIDNSAATGDSSQNFTGGMTVDSNGFNLTYTSALMGAAGNGVKQGDISITGGGGSGYTGAPMVQFTGGTLATNGTPASGYAIISGGAVTGIVITAPGTYTADPIVTLTGGGGSGAGVTLSALTANPADSGITKIGTGTLTLSGANTYTGGTLVSGGTVKFSTAFPATTTVTVAGSAAAGVLVGATDTQWVDTGNLVLQNSSNLLIDYGSTAPSTTIAPIKVTDFTIGTTHGVTLISNPGSALLVGQPYPLVTWTGTGPVDGTAFTCLTHRLSGTFSVSSNTLYFTVTSNAAGVPISWNTGNGTWNTVAVNWLDGSLAATTYIDTLDSVSFGDASGASGNPTVTLGTALSPLGVTMNSTAHDYTVSGAGSIGGSGSLTLSSTNTRTFTLATVGNSFTGGTNVNGGTLVLGDATNTLLDTGAVAVDGASSTLSLGTNSDTVGAVSLKNGAAISGSGTLTGVSYALESGNISAKLGGSAALTKTTAGIVTLSGDNSAATGVANISGGTLVAAHVNALNTTGSVSISTTTGSGTLQLATDTSVATFPLGSSSSFPGTIISDRATAGPGITHVIGHAVLGGNIWTVQAGGNVMSGTAGVSIDSVNLAAGSAVTCTFNPTNAKILIPGAVNIGSSSLAKTLALAGDSAGNEISGVISNNLNTLSVSKSGNSIWTLSGADIYSGTTTVSGGTLSLTGSLINASLGNLVVTGGNLTVAGTVTGSTSTTSLTYGTAAGLSTVNVSTGADLALANVQGANNTNAVSVYHQTGGAVTVSTAGGVAESAFAATSGYGFMELSGGSYSANSRFTVALNGTGGGKGITRVGGGAGSASLAAGDLLSMSRGGGSIGEMTVLANGTVTYNATGANNMLLIGNSGAQAGYLNIVGGTFSSPSTLRSIAYGNGTSTNTSIGLINLGSGTLELGKEIAINTIASGTNRGFINLSGGTVKLLATTSANLLLPASNGGFTSLANTIFGKITNSKADNAGAGAASGISGTIATTQDFNGGVTINTNGFDSTISGPLTAPTGGGIAQGNVSITDPGAGYAAAPLVTFSNPTAANATPAAGYALVSGGQLSGIVITSPGSYDPADTVTVTLTGGGASTAATVADIAGASLTANTSGGLNKVGAGTLTLSGANTYTGDTTVTDGTLALTSTGQLKFLLGASSGLNNSISGAGTVTLDGSFVIDTSAADALTSGTWILENVASLMGAYGSNFSVAGFADATGNLWTKTIGGGKTYTFDETTGTLTLTVQAGYDAWKTQITNGLTLRTDDADGDGFTNLQEFLFGTSPIASNGSLVTTTTGGGNIVLRWLQRENGSSYTLEKSTTLAIGSWTTATEVPAMDGVQTGAPTDYDYYTVTIPTGSGNLFFRIDGVEN